MIDTLSNSPRVSVAMCTFNGARYLFEQLMSIATQTVLPFELVIQDDGSTDLTSSIIAEFSDTVPFVVRFSTNEHRQGSAANFDSCMLKCVGDIIVLSDQDDIWTHDRLERTLNAFESNRDLLFVFSDAALIDDQGRMLGRTIFETVAVTKTDRRTLACGDGLTGLILRYGVLYGATMSVRRDTLRQILPVPEGWSHDEWISLALGALGRSMCLAPVIYYRQHVTQSVGAGAAGLAAMMTAARKRDDIFYQSEIERYSTAVDLVRFNPLLRSPLLKILQEKLEFLKFRANIRANGRNVISVSKILVYFPKYVQFAVGVRSIVKDLKVAILK